MPLKNPCLSDVLRIDILHFSNCNLLRVTYFTPGKKKKREWDLFRASRAVSNMCIMNRELVLWRERAAERMNLFHYRRIRRLGRI